jgi:hypothetical protein
MKVRPFIRFLVDKAGGQNVPLGTFLLGADELGRLIRSEITALSSAKLKNLGRQFSLRRVREGEESACQTALRFFV